MGQERDAELLFLHGLESGPGGHKARWLREHYGAAVPHLDSSAVIALRDRAFQGEWEWSSESEELARAMARPVAQAGEALEALEAPRVVVGSSFGGAVLLQLLNEGLWSGPCVFLACAGLHLTPYRSLPGSARKVLLHGRNDTKIELDHSRQLVASAGPEAQLWELCYEHRMTEILEDGTLAAALSWVSGGALPPRP